MALKRVEGGIQPGIRWGPFTIRIPGVHVGLSWPEIIQGGLLSMATAAAAAPLFMKCFGLSFEQAWALSILPMIWYFSQAILFGEPYAPGWITPAIPLVLVFLGGFGSGVEAIKAMTALSLMVSAIFLVFGITGLGKKFFSWVPVELRAAIILASAIAAFNGEFARHSSMPITLSIVWAVVFVLMFSLWFSKRKTGNKVLLRIASMSMLVGFLVAAVAGPLSGEFNFKIEMGIYVPPFADAIMAVSPFFIGWPSLELCLQALPLAFMVYVIVFGDLVLANTLLDEAGKIRTDEKVVQDTTRTHYTLFLRNIGQLLTMGPLIPQHGPIWTGVTVFLVERYKEGRHQMDSIFTGILNWYWPAFILVFLTPLVTFMKPMLPVALSITLILTGFACAYIAMRMVTNSTSQGYALFTALAIVKFGPGWGLLLGILLYFLICAKFDKSEGMFKSDPVSKYPSTQ
ncbi:MAG: hypothetical protein ACOY46_04320 [Bacillota bacterium]